MKSTGYGFVSATVNNAGNKRHEVVSASDIYYNNGTAYISLDYYVRLMCSTGMGPYMYEDAFGDTYLQKWTITDIDFMDVNSLTLKEIEAIMRLKNPELIDYGFHKKLFEASEKYNINPKILLATLQSEQRWGQDNIRAAMGIIDKNGNPIAFEDATEGVMYAAKTYAKWFEKGEDFMINGKFSESFSINTDPGHEDAMTRAWLFGTDKSPPHPQDAWFFEYEQTLTPANRAQYARMNYTPWMWHPATYHGMYEFQKAYYDMDAYLLEAKAAGLYK